MKWLINGMALTWGESVKIKPDKNKIDTVLFKLNEKAQWDTLICNISAPHQYRFVYNACCGGFNIENKTLNISPKGRVLFKQGEKSTSTYLGRLAETGVLLSTVAIDTVTPLCRRAMSPNIYQVSVDEIMPFTDAACESEELFCLYGKEIDYDFTFKVTKPIGSFMYMPLERETLVIWLNTKSGYLRIHW